MNAKRLLSAALCAVMALGSVCQVMAAEPGDPGTLEKVNNTYYYHSKNDGEYIFEKVSHPDRGPGEIDGLLDEEDSRSQSYAWSAVESGDYIYIGTCYNSTYGIYWRNVYSMMIKAGKTPAEAQKIARDFVQFVFNDKFDERLKPRGIVVKLNKITGEFSAVYDSKESGDSDISATSCSGYRMAFEFKGALYFVSLGAPTMFLLKITPGADGSEECSIAYKRSLSKEGSAKQIAGGVHGLIVYDDEILMCLADEERTWPDGKTYPEGGIIIASPDGENWRVIADNNTFDGMPGYHNYDGLFGGGVWDIIEYNGHVYVTVVTDLTDPATAIVAKRGFAMYRGTKHDDGSFTWEQMIGDMNKDGVKYPFGLGTTIAMACNLWVYKGYLYMGTYNDPMVDLAEVPAKGDFEPLYNDLFYSINLYRMDEKENIELIGGKPNDVFKTVKGNMGEGLGNNNNQYVWRMVEHEGKLWIGTYDTSTLTYVFTQLTDGQLVGMTEEEYNNRLKQLKKFMTSLGILKEEYGDIFDAVFGSAIMRNLFDSMQRLIDAGTGDKDPVVPYKEMVAKYNEFKDKVTNYKPLLPSSQIIYKALLKALNEMFFEPMDKLIEDIRKPVFYFGVNYYAKQAVRGFDILVSEDGVNFEVVTDDGFGDESNHGVRTLTSATIDNGDEIMDALFAGTANPYFGAQVWKTITGEIEKPNPDELPDAPDKDEVIDIINGDEVVSIICDDNDEHEESYGIEKDAFEVGEVSKDEDGVITVPVVVDINALFDVEVADEEEPSEGTVADEEEPSEGTVADEEELLEGAGAEELNDQEAVAKAKKSYLDLFNEEFETDHTVVGESKKSFNLVWDDNDKCWTAEDAEVEFTVTEQEIEGECIVTFDCGENGKFADTNETSVEVKAEQGQQIGAKNIPEIEADDGYKFKCWKDESGKEYTNDQIGAFVPDTESVKFTAVYEEVSDAENITVTFKAGAFGKFSENEKTVFSIEKGGKVSSVPNVIPNSGYAFNGWKVMNDKNTYTSDEILNMKFSASTDITADYSFIGETEEPEVTVYSVKFNDGEHGSLIGLKEYSIEEGKKILTVPAVDADDGYVFTNWYCSEDGKTYSSAEVKDILVVSDLTFSAQYKKLQSSDDDGDGEGGSNGGGSNGGGSNGSASTDKDNENNVEITENAENNIKDILEKLEHFAYIFGYPDGTICPDGKITREEVASIFYRLLKDSVREENETEHNSLSDVEEGRWSNKAISTLASMGIISGYPDGTFRPSMPITRAEFAVIASKFEELETLDKELFNDVDAHWAKAYINSAAAKGWISGYPDGTFLPDSQITRAEAVSMINRVLERKVSADGLTDEYKTYRDNKEGAWYYFDMLEASNSHTYTKDGSTEKWSELSEDKVWE